jgi:hypothetical protein
MMDETGNVAGTYREMRRCQSIRRFVEIECRTFFQ